MKTKAIVTIEQKWPSDLVLVRHGESARNVAKAAAMRDGLHELGSGLRDMDVPLTAVGVEQAQQTGKYLASKFTFDRIFASPYVRTAETARHIASQFAAVPEITFEERIREKELGIIDGLTKERMFGRYAKEAARRQREGKYYYRPLGGESHPDVALRIHSFLGTLSRDFRQRSVLVICTRSWCSRFGRCSSDGAKRTLWLWIETEIRMSGIAR